MDLTSAIIGAIVGGLPTVATAVVMLYRTFAKGTIAYQDANEQRHKRYVDRLEADADRRTRQIEALQRANDLLAEECVMAREDIQIVYGELVRCHDYCKERSEDLKAAGKECPALPELIPRPRRVSHAADFIARTAKTNTQLVLEAGGTAPPESPAENDNET